MPISVIDLAYFRGVSEVDEISAEDITKVGLPAFGGCSSCAACLAAYNAYPSKDGFLKCEMCIGDLGWEDVEKANKDIFGE